MRINAVNNFPISVNKNNTTNYNPNFSANFKFLKTDEFKKVVNSIDSENSIKAPSTFKESIRAKQAYTEDICDGVAGGITNGEEVVMFNLDKDLLNEEETEFNIIKKLISKPGKLQGFLIGSDAKGKHDGKLFEKLEDFMTKLNIPFTKLKGEIYPENNRTAIAYKAESDTWFINNEITNACLSCETLKDKLPNVVIHSFNSVRFAPNDKLTY